MLGASEGGIVSQFFFVRFSRDQLTTTEVNMARVYNWDVKRRQAAGQASTN